jgi:DNA-binding MarR family transcriptional regulator
MNQSDIKIFRKHLRKLERETGILLSSETECCSVTVAQCHLLLELEADETLGLQDLSDILSLDKSTLSRTIDGCVQKGFIERSIDTKNRRKNILTLTELGSQKCDLINSLCNDQFSRIFSHIPEDKRDSVIESVFLLSEAMAKERQEGNSSCCSR